MTEWERNMKAAKKGREEVGRKKKVKMRGRNGERR